MALNGRTTSFVCFIVLLHLQVGTLVRFCALDGADNGVAATHAPMQHGNAAAEGGEESCDDDKTLECCRIIGSGVFSLTLVDTHTNHGVLDNRATTPVSAAAHSSRNTSPDPPPPKA